MLALGPFELVKALSAGGMGQVWLALHRQTQQPAAVKVLTIEAARSPRRVRSIKNEVRAAAALDHPNVVRVFDYGLVDAAAMRASRQSLEVGSPYIVMEYGSAGSLRPHSGRLKWRDLRVLLRHILKGLAHAHARGVIHRDIKPDNVILTEHGEPKLTDFGIAAAIVHGPQDDSVVRAATPAYTAPEQIHGTWRDQGPWTDLYAFGCLSYMLASGAPPFVHRRSVPEMARAHMVEPPPPLVPRYPLPDGFEAWTRRLLEKRPRDRYHRVADALRALEALDAEVDDDAPLPDPFVAGANPRARTTLVLPDDDAAPAPAAGPATGDPAGVAPLPLPAQPPPCPSDWRDPAVTARPEAPAGVGLGVYGLRTIPLVNRAAERDALWAALAAVRAAGAPRSVLLRGPAGCGKSRLAAWLCERAHELGVAHVLRAGHSPIVGSTDGLDAMIARELRVTGLQPADAFPRVRRWLSDRGVDNLHELRALLQIATSSAADSYRFSNPVERYLVVSRFLDNLAAERPIVLWLDDVQWGLDAIFLVAHLHAHREHPPQPILSVLTAQDEALATRPVEAARLAELKRRGRITEVEVGPLGVADARALVGELLGLDGELAARVVARTAGNPLFAIQLVGDWVQRGLLQPARAGFRLTTGAAVPLPDDLHQLWSERLDELLAVRGPKDQAALEIAAVLGNEVAPDEWIAACDKSPDARAAALHELAEVLLARRFWRANSTSASDEAVTWSFVHPMLRESLERRAHEAGRWERHHQACADMLRDHAPSERLARHLLESGADESALTPLLEVARRFVATGHYQSCASILDERERLAASCALPSANPRWGEGWAVRSGLMRQQGRIDDATRWAEQAERVARVYGWKPVEAEAIYHHAAALHWQGRYEDAWPRFTAARLQAQALGDEALDVKCLEGMARTVFDRGEHERAGPMLIEAIERYEALGTPILGARLRLVLAQYHMRGGRYDAAAAELTRAAQVFEQDGARADLSDAVNMRGELARERGDLEAAAAHYTQAAAAQRRLGAGNAIISEMNLGLVHLVSRRFAAAREVLTTCLAELERQDLPRLVGAAHVHLATAAAGLGDWVRCDHHLMVGARLLTDTGFVEADNAVSAELAGDLAMAAQQPLHAARAWALAALTWERLGRASRSQALAAKIRRVRGMDG